MPQVVMSNNLNQQDDATSITHFLSRVFRKVVRLVIGTVSLPALTDILKAIYVEEAQKKLLREFKDSLGEGGAKHSPRETSWFQGVKDFFDGLTS